MDMVGIIIFIILIIFLPVIIRMRMFSAVEGAIRELDDMEKKARKIIIDLSGITDEGLLDDYLEFFIVPPADIDPSGLADKFRRLLEMGDLRIREMVEELSPDADSEKKANIIMCIKVTAGIRGILKFLRHNLELSRKTGNLQILVGLQMNLELIMRTARAYLEGCSAISSSLPLGDGAGPLTAGMLIDEEDRKKHLHEMVYVRKRFLDKDIGILKPHGPGSRLGMVVKALEEILSEDEFHEVIMVDAAAKMEGENTGAVAEGVGVAIGGPGVEKWFMENMILEHRTRAIIIKMSPEEAMSHMTREILDACSAARSRIEDIISRSDADSILIIGVGNSSGIPDAVENPGEIQVKEKDDT